MFLARMAYKFKQISLKNTIRAREKTLKGVKKVVSGLLTALQRA